MLAILNDVPFSQSQLSLENKSVKAAFSKQLKLKKFLDFTF